MHFPCFDSASRTRAINLRNVNLFQNEWRRGQCELALRTRNFRDKYRAHEEELVSNQSMSAITISVSPAPVHRLTFDVVVRDARGESRHKVTMQTAEAERWAKLGAKPLHCVEAAMRFLLDREPKEFDSQRVRHGGHSALLSRVRRCASRLPRPVRRRTGTRRIAVAQSTEGSLHDRRPRPAGGDFRVPLHRVRRLGLYDRYAGAGAPAHPAAPARCSGGPQHRRVYFRLSRLAAWALRHRALARCGAAQAAQHRLPPGAQRGSRRNGDLGRPATEQFSRRDRRWRVRHLVRQGAGRRPIGRCAAPRQFHRRLAQGRRACARRRRPRREILDRGQFLRHIVHRRRHARPLSLQHAGAARLRSARDRHVAVLGLLGWDEGCHRRRRRRRYGLCRARPA